MLQHSYNLAERYFGDMKSKIISIGNSKGVIIPSSFMKDLGLTDAVEMEVGMFSEFIRAKLTQRYGKELESIADCHDLAAQISEVTKFKLSAETLGDLFGIHSKRKEPALFTAEVIAHYLGCHSSNQMRDEYNQQKYELLGGNN